jgi:peptide/nickel transport system permease protein
MTPDLKAVAGVDEARGDVATAAAGPRGRRVVRPGIAAGAGFLVLLLLAAAWPQLLTSINPNDANVLQTLDPPSAAHWLGTDQNGRDVFARVVAGARPSLLIGACSSGLALLAGTVLGVLAAQGGRLANAVVSRLLDTFLAIPGLLLVLLVIAVLGPGTRNAIIGLALMMAPGYARMVRGEVIRIRNAAYIEAAHGLGWRRWQVVVRHLVPNALGPATVLATIGVGAAIGAGASLSYLGLGPQEPTAEWGAMLSQSTEYFSVAWWAAVFPGIAITLTVLSVTVVGQHLQRRLDGRTRP